jgi:hypothetical protein
MFGLYNCSIDIRVDANLLYRLSLFLDLVRNYTVDVKCTSIVIEYNVDVVFSFNEEMKGRI